MNTGKRTRVGVFVKSTPGVIPPLDSYADQVHILLCTKTYMPPQCGHDLARFVSYIILRYGQSKFDLNIAKILEEERKCLSGRSFNLFEVLVTI